MVKRIVVADKFLVQFQILHPKFLDERRKTIHSSVHNIMKELIELGKKALVDNYSEQELRDLVKQSQSYRDLTLKLGYNSDGGNGYKTVQNRVQKYGIDTSHFQEHHARTRSVDNIFIKNSTATQAVLRRWYFKGNYTEYKCAICGLPAEWNGKPLVLTLDHINGNNKDDRLENLRWVCPNCDRQLPTYSRGAGRVDEI